MSMLSLKPSCSNAGLHANLIIGGGPHTSICSERHRPSERWALSECRRQRACVSLPGGGRCAFICVAASASRQSAIAPHACKWGRTMSALMKPVLKAHPLGGRSSV